MQDKSSSLFAMSSPQQKNDMSLQQNVMRIQCGQQQRRGDTEANAEQSAQGQWVTRKANHKHNHDNASTIAMHRLSLPLCRSVLAAALVGLALVMLPSTEMKALTYTGWWTARLLGSARAPPDVAGIQHGASVAIPFGNATETLQVHTWPELAAVKEQSRWKDSNSDEADLYFQAGQKFEMEREWPIEVENRGRVFFCMLFLCSLSAAAMKYIFKQDPTVVLAFARGYQAVGHAIYAFGLGNDFTKFSARSGWGLWNDSFGFLVEGMVYGHSPILAWGLMHMSHYGMLVMLPKISIGIIESQGIVFWFNMISDMVMNTWAMVYVFNQLRKNNNVESGTTDTLATLLLFVAALVWVLVNLS